MTRKGTIDVLMQSAFQVAANQKSHGHELAQAHSCVAPIARHGGFCEHEDVKSKQGPDKEIHIRKNVAGGTTGALLGAAVGGPVGALVGGVIGAAIGNAAETGKFAKSVAKAEPSKPIAQAKAALKKPTQKARRSVKAPAKAKPQGATPPSSRRSKGKSKS